MQRTHFATARLATLGLALALMTTACGTAASDDAARSTPEPAAPSPTATETTPEIAPEITTVASTVRVVGVQKTAYKRAGGKAKLGTALDNATCGLPAGGCLQHFTKGTVYTQGKKYGYATTTGLAGEIIAAERSQVGYVEKYVSGKHKTWLNTWMKSTREWCSFLQSWGAWATGHPTAIPKATNWGRFSTYATSRLKKGTKPKVGALAMYDFKPDGRPDHVGLVTAVSGSRIKTIEGNTTGGGLLPHGKRGIVEVWRARSNVAYYLYPGTSTKS